MLNLTQLTLSTRMLGNKEWLRALLLFGLVLYVYHPFLSGLNIGAMDARWYQYLLHDALLQYDHHLFPPEVGQSLFNYIGVSYIRAPFYLLLGIFLHIITFGTFNALYIQHLVVICSALTGAFLTYFLFTKIAPNSRWLALALAFFYVSCPGVAALIYKMDMYFSFVAIPFIPLAIYGLVRIHLINDILGYILLTAGLSLVWLSHPPIALWFSCCCGFVLGMQFIFHQRNIFKLSIIPILFLILNAWQFSGVFGMGMQDYYGVSENFLDYVTKALRNDLPGAILPLGWQIKGTPFLQLGYSMWFVLFAGLFVGLRLRSFLIGNLALCITLIILLLFPIPDFAYKLWSFVPLCLDLVSPYPMERLYVILAAFVSFLGILTLSKLTSTKNSRIVGSIIFCLIIWNIYQMNYLIKGTYAGTNNSWVLPQNLLLIPYGSQPNHPRIGAFNSYNPLLKNKLFDKEFKPIGQFDNEQFLLNKCLQNKFKTPEGIQVKTMENYPLISSSVLKPYFEINGFSNKHLLLCLETLQTNTGINAELLNETNSLVSDISFPNNQAIAIPFEHDKKFNKDGWSLYLSNIPSQNNSISPVKINSYGLINFDADDLPIKINSFTPYQAEVNTDRDETYLSVYKEYFDGYSAKVNGEKVKPIPDNEKMLLIPLKHKGKNTIELIYKGASFINLAFWVSTLGWLFVLTYLFVIFKRKYFSKLKLNIR